MNNISFQSTYLIPFNQIKDSEQMKKIGAESVKYTDANTLAANNEGIVITVDDKKDKEYEAIVAKYGVNIQKYDKKAEPVAMKPNAITPTGKPIIRFADKNGEKFMAREVKLENGYICVAVASETDPEKVALMNKEEFTKTFIQTVPKMN